MDVLTQIKYFLGVFAVFLAIFGTISNSMIAITIICRQKLRSVPTFVITGFMVVVETIPLFGSNLNAYSTIFNGFGFDSVNYYFCRSYMFLHSIGTHAAAWLLIFMSLERLLSIKFKSWRTRTFNSKKAAIVSIGIITFFAIFNFHLNFENTFTIKYINGTMVTSCKQSPTLAFWSSVNLYVYSIGPFIILTVINCLLVNYGVIQRSKNIQISNQDKRKRKQLTISVIAFTLSFFAMTGPISICSGFFLYYFLTDPYKTTTLSLLNALRFSFNGTNLIALLVFNRAFRAEFKVFIRSGSANQVTTSMDSTHLSHSTRNK